MNWYEHKVKLALAVLKANTTLTRHELILCRHFKLLRLNAKYCAEHIMTLRRETADNYDNTDEV